MNGQWSGNELVIVVIHLAKKSKHILKVFAVPSFPSFPKSWRTFWWSMGMCIVGCHNCDTVGVLSRQCWCPLQIHATSLCSPTCSCDPPLVLFDVGTLFFENLKVGWASGFGDTNSRFICWRGLKHYVTTLEIWCCLQNICWVGFSRIIMGFLLLYHFLWFASNMWLVGFVRLHMWVYR